MITVNINHLRAVPLNMTALVAIAFGCSTARTRHDRHLADAETVSCLGVRLNICLVVHLPTFCTTCSLEVILSLLSEAGVCLGLFSTFAWMSNATDGSIVLSVSCLFQCKHYWMSPWGRPVACFLCIVKTDVMALIMVSFSGWTSSTGMLSLPLTYLLHCLDCYFIFFTKDWTAVIVWTC